MKRVVALGALVLAATALAQTAVQAPPAPAPSPAPATPSAALTLRCEPVYLPARSAWRRTVTLSMDEARIRQVLIDGVPVYTFSVDGTTLLTALDNERIQIDTATMTWTSDFRGQASAQGRCERE